MTCYRVGMRMDEPQIPALLVAHHRPGFYLRVITEGHVEAGRRSSGSRPARTHERRRSRRGALPARAPARTTRTGAADPRAQPRLAASFRDLHNATTREVRRPVRRSASPPAWPGFRPLRVAATHRESRTVFSFWLGRRRSVRCPPHSRAVRDHQAATDDGDRQPLRNYSLSGEPGATDIPNQRQGRSRTGRPVRACRPTSGSATALEVAAPRGDFLLVDGDDPVVLLSAGIGATPVLAMLYALADARSPRQVWWLHGARDGAEHAFAAESRAVLGRLADVRRCDICYSSPAPAERLAIDYTDAAISTAELLAGCGVPADADAYVCGPASFMDGIAARARPARPDPHPDPHRSLRRAAPAWLPAS